MSTVRPPQVLFFDTFGTVVDWRSCVTNALRAATRQVLENPNKDIPANVRQIATALSESDWQSLAQAWRASYFVFTREFDPSSEFVSVDQHYYTALQDLLQQRGIRELFNDDELWQLTMAWHRLTPWSDSARGLHLLNRKFITSTLSNGNISLLEDLKQYGQLPFAELVSSENFGAYKPSPIVYNGAAKILGYAPSQCALVAAHLGDLKAAKNCGFQTIYVERELEEAWNSDRIAQAKADGLVDMWIGPNEGGFVEAARRFGIE